MLLEVIRLYPTHRRFVLSSPYIMCSLKHSSNPLKDAAFKALHIHLGKSDGNRCYLTESSAVRHCELQLFVELLIVPVRNLLPKLSCGAYISDVNCALPNPIGKRNNRS